MSNNVVKMASCFFFRKAEFKKTHLQQTEKKWKTKHTLTNTRTTKYGHLELKIDTFFVLPMKSKPWK